VLLRHQLGEVQANVRLPKRVHKVRERAEANLEAKLESIKHQGKKGQRTIRSKDVRQHSFTGRTTSIQHRKAFKINMAWV